MDVMTNRTHLCISFWTMKQNITSSLMSLPVTSHPKGNTNWNIPKAQIIFTCFVLNIYKGIIKIREGGRGG